ncbi:MAG: hypothetical protein MAG453_00460 [Calditrichaeota bacterium]|nr:hypothetical protein [Calditrichota bacterium]
MRVALVTLVAFVPLLMVEAASAGHRVAEWAIAGRMDSLRAAVADGRWDGTPAGDLARALTVDDAALAVALYRRIARDQAAPPEIAAVAWHRIYGYAVVRDYPATANDALRWLGDHPEVSRSLFHGGLPDPLPDATTESAVPSDYWCVQLGAFARRANADRLAAEQRARGFTVRIDTLTAGGRTLHAVRVGRFDSERDARSFGERVYGAAGDPWRTVEISH